MNRHTYQRGFTVVEILMIVTVIGLLITPVLGGIFYFYGNTVISNQKVQLASESRNLLRSLFEELRVASGVRATNTISDANAPSGGWATSNPNKVLVVATPALNTSNNFIINTATSKPYQNEIVYFASGRNLYKRILANASATGNRMRTNCPAAVATTTCPADVLLSDRLYTLDFSFYDAANAATATPSSTRSLQLLITLTDRLFGQTITFDNNARVTFRNKE